MKLKYFASAVLLASLLLTGCGSDLQNPVTSTGSAPLAIPPGMSEIMARPRYEDATFSLLVRDLETGETYYNLNSDSLSFTGSTRKLFSVGMALNTLGSEHRRTTSVHRQGVVDASGVLDGDLVLVADGDLTFGGRRLPDEQIEYTSLDHNEANSLGSAVLTPQDPLYALDQLAAGVKASGIDSVAGDVVVDDRLFETYRVPNGDLLITPMMLNENQIDVTISPTQPGTAADLVHRPETGFFNVVHQVVTAAPGSEETVEFSGDRLTSGVGDTGIVQGNLPTDYTAPLTGLNDYVGTFRVEDPNSFARIAFVEALERHGVAVNAPTVAANPTSLLPATFSWTGATSVAEYVSEPYSEIAQLILKVSLNQGANLSLTLFGLSQGERTIEGALAAEREALVEDFGLSGEQFNFPTNGSGSPDSQASPSGLVQLLIEMATRPEAEVYRAALPILGVDGSLAHSGENLPARGHVFAKTGTTLAPDSEGRLQLKALNFAGYIETRGGRTVAYALMLNDAGPVNDIETDIGGVNEDLAAISSLIYESL